ncbi:unnamed protein product, partial [Echinostoma caproni]|uniref:Flocculation protein FLO11-like n=1 Tax=Echinostoma caproni TaxID=27848 RepID=A0A183A439_9TREM
FTNYSKFKGDSEPLEIDATPTPQPVKEPTSRASTQSKKASKSSRTSSQFSRTESQRAHTAPQQRSSKAQHSRSQARSSVATPKATASQDKAARTTSPAATDTPVGGAVLGTRRPGLLVTRTPSSSGHTASVVIKKQISTDASSATSSVTPPTTNSSGVIMLHQRRVNPSNYIIRPSTSESEPALVVPSNLVKGNESGLWTPGKRGRPPIAMSMAKRQALIFEYRCFCRKPF